MSKEVHIQIKLESEIIELDRWAHDDDEGSIFLEIVPKYAEDHGVLSCLTEEQAKALYDGLHTALYGTLPEWVPSHDSVQT